MAAKCSTPGSPRSSTGTGLDAPDGTDWAIDSFRNEPDRALIVYGTARDVHAQREAATILQDRIARGFGNYQVPIKSDAEVTEAELSSHHVLLIGRPGTNAVATRLSDSLPVAYGPGSFRVGESTYGHARTAIVAAGPNPSAPGRYSLVVFSGLSAESTRLCVSSLFDRGAAPAPAVLTVAGSPPRRSSSPPGPPGRPGWPGSERPGGEEIRVSR